MIRVAMMRCPQALTSGRIALAQATPGRRRTDTNVLVVEPSLAAPVILFQRGLHGTRYRAEERDRQQQRPSAARLVITHSSYMEGLIPLLDRLVADPDTAGRISTVVPGRLYSCAGRSELFKMTVRDTSNGFKVLARKGSSVQEVFIGTTQMGLDDLKIALNRAAGFDLEKGGSRREQRAGGKRR